MNEVSGPPGLIRRAKSWFSESWSMAREQPYRLSPIVAQNLAVSIYGARILRKRYGRGYDAILQAVLDRRHWSRDQILEFQSRRLRQLIAHCYEKVPYYRAVFREKGLEPGDIQVVEDLGKLPILRKGDINQQRDEFLATDSGARRHIHSHTSGTTGMGLQFLIDLAAHQEQWAVWWRYRLACGIPPRTWCSYFGGRIFVPGSQSEPPFWRVNLAGRQVLYSVHHMSWERLRDYAKDLRHRQLTWLHGYPSALAMMSRFVLENGPPLRYRWATVGAENLYPWQKKLIEDAFGCRCWQHYGAAEGVANFSECEAGNLHADEDFSVVELVPLPGPHQYSIVGTSLLNYTMPFIRYDTGDLCGEPVRTCPCGRQGLVLSRIDGRHEDYVISKDGRLVGRLDHSFKDARAISAAQIVQHEPGKAIIRIVPTPEWTQRDAAALLREFRARIGDLLDIKIEYHSALETDVNGKLRFVVSKLHAGRLDSVRANHEQ